jgi:hypothetical protein
MSQEAARQAIVTAVEAAKTGAPVPSLVIEYDNRIIVDTQTQSAPFLRVEIKYLDSYQADISHSPIHRFEGYISLQAAVKDGSGAKEANGLLEHFYPQLHKRSMGIVRTKMASAVPERQHQGWWYYSFNIPFWFDRTY